MKHGAFRSHGIQRVSSSKLELTDPQGNVIYSGLGSSTEMTIAETYCEHCQAWISTNGVMGALEYAAKHRDGDCQKS